MHKEFRSFPLPYFFQSFPNKKSVPTGRCFTQNYNRVSKILLQNEDWTQNEWYLIL
ncbi:hypothetical protein LEP1GSC068_3116 [Leptospira sp. Fiocruz LV3954]|nr:hypothetical protein LEP1GSC068_3116 [Leptospira sp. Fiocruz LV3954]EMI68713.1 hypothetical protein LEP1GSC076_2316 [Leptospira sp. Fiocruz LV4135]